MLPWAQSKPISRGNFVNEKLLNFKIFITFNDVDLSLFLNLCWNFVYRKYLESFWTCFATVFINFIHFLTFLSPLQEFLKLLLFMATTWFKLSSKLFVLFSIIYFLCFFPVKENLGKFGKHCKQREIFITWNNCICILFLMQNTKKSLTWTHILINISFTVCSFQ